MQVYSIPLNKDKKEITRHGTPDFPLAIYETCPRKNVMGSVVWHWHEEAQFCYVASGQVRFRTHSQSHVLSKGQGLFIAPNVLHCAEAVFGEEDAYVCIDFHPILICGFPGSAIARRYLPPLLENAACASFPYLGQAPWERASLRALRQIHGLFHRKAPGYELEIVSWLLRVWQLLYTHMDSPQEADSLSFRRDNERLKAILNYLHEHYPEKISLEDIASHVHVNKNECCRFFKSYMGCSIFTYLTDYRLAQSIALLQSTDLPVGHIASACGFGSASYYIEQFRKKKRTTPKEYRSAGKDAPTSAAADSSPS